MFAIALTLLIIDVRIPVTTAIGTSADLWLALRHLWPSVFVFVLSFGISFISWVSHREAMMSGSCASMGASRVPAMRTTLGVSTPLTNWQSLRVASHVDPPTVRTSRAAQWRSNRHNGAPGWHG